MLQVSGIKSLLLPNNLVPISLSRILISFYFFQFILLREFISPLSSSTEAAAAAATATVISL